MSLKIIMYEKIEIKKKKILNQQKLSYEISVSPPQQRLQGQAVPTQRARSLPG